MKKIIFSTMIASLLAFVGCQNEELVNDNNTDNSGKKVILTANIQGAADSRVALTPDTENGDPIVKVAWREYDENDPETFSVVGENGQSMFTQVSDTEFSGTLPESYNSGASYYAFYNLELWSDMGRNYTFEQDGTLREQDMMMMAFFNEGDTSIEFQHMMSILKPTFKVGEDTVNNTITHIEMGVIEACSTTVVIDVKPTAPATTLQDDIYLTIPVMKTLFPDLTNFIPGITFNFAVTAGGKDYTGSLTIPNIANWEPEGKLFTATIGLEEAPPMGDKTAATAVKGDFAMADGTFISKDATLTNEQKANVRGIVFWTESEEGNATLASDVIMQTDYPNCNHGLIVSLTDVSTSCAWQGIKENSDQKYYQHIYTEFQMYDDTYKNYAAIASGSDASSNINEILGYNNTKVLEAYNADCMEKDKSNCLIRPIEALATWKASNSNIHNTTGWFLPSAKELHMLCYKDVANVINENGTDKIETKNAVNASLEKVNGSLFGDTSWYWSSSENTRYHNEAFEVGFSKGKVTAYPKYWYQNFVRAVCAF